MTAAVETVPVKTQTAVHPVSLSEKPKVSKSPSFALNKSQADHTKITKAKADSSKSKSTQPATVGSVAVSNKASIKTRDSLQTNNALKMKSTAISASAKKSKGSNTTTKKGGNGENTGRWPKEEHEKFVKGLDMYGKEWKKIANMIETRTVVQIRTHAQKYFQKIAKTKFEQLGKQVPTDLMSTASNTSKHKKGSPLSLSEALSVAADVPFGAKRDSKDKAKSKPRTGSTTKKSYSKKNVKENCNKSVNATASLKGRRVSDNISARPSKSQKSVNKRSPTGKAYGSVKPEKLTISTVDSLRKKNEEDDFKWMVNSMTRGLYPKNKDSRPDASPTGVADFGLYRTFGSSSSASDFDEDPEDQSDMMHIYDHDETLMFDDRMFKVDSPSIGGLNIPMISSNVDDLGADLGESNQTLQFEMDKTIEDWINSPEADCTLDSFAGINPNTSIAPLY